jgi:outer membrane protein assembly factor BamA
MKISIGFPINAQPGDLVQHFQFQLGNVF